MGARSSFYSLPPAVRMDIEKRLAANGFRQYAQLVAKLRARGFHITTSSLHRYGQKLERCIAGLHAQRLETELATGAVSAPKVRAPSTASLTIGQRLRHERERMGFTQGAMSARAGIPTDTYVKYERDGCEPGAGALAKMALAGIDIVWVLTGKGRG